MAIDVFAAWTFRPRQRIGIEAWQRCHPQQLGVVHELPDGRPTVVIPWAWHFAGAVAHVYYDGRWAKRPLCLAFVIEVLADVEDEPVREYEYVWLDDPTPLTGWYAVEGSRCVRDPYMDEILDRLLLVARKCGL